MLAEGELSVDVLRGGTSLRRLLRYGPFVLVAQGTTVGVIGAASRLAPQDSLSAAPATAAAVGQGRGGR